MKRVILDTDIGTDVDDAMALSLAAVSPELELIGVTTVHADAPLRARIARRLLALAGRFDIPVIPGASQPLKMPLPEGFTWMPTLRGHEGVGILSEEELIPTPNKETTADDAANFIIEQAAKNHGDISLLAIGPLTNIGRALQLEPSLSDWICDLIVMGGTVYAEKFPFPPMLETNLNADPEASALVFASGIPLTIVPMEITTQVYLTPEQRKMMLGWNEPLSTTLVTLMEKMFDGMASLSTEAGLEADFYQGRTFMHDPLAVYTAFASQHIQTRRMNVQYEVVDRVVRTMPYHDRSPNCHVCVNVNADAFISFCLDRIRAVTTS